ncbi:hypothetical protein ACJMK2_044630, partial [Sinanodonta woodiana]
KCKYLAGVYTWVRPDRYVNWTGDCHFKEITGNYHGMGVFQVMLLFYRTNPGIKYQYTIPAGLMERVIQTYQADPVSSSTRAHRRRHQHFTAPLQTNSSAEFTNTQDTPSKDKESSDQSFGRSFRFGQNPRYIAPEVQTSNYEPLQSNQGQYGTQEAINRFRAGSNKVQLQTDQNRVETGSTNYRVNDVNRQQPVYSLSGYDRTRSQTSHDIDRVNQIENQPRIATTIDRINFLWRISGFTECSQTCGGGDFLVSRISVKVKEDSCFQIVWKVLLTLSCQYVACVKNPVDIKLSICCLCEKVLLTLSCQYVACVKVLLIPCPLCSVCGFVYHSSFIFILGAMSKLHPRFPIINLNSCGIWDLPPQGRD